MSEQKPKRMEDAAFQRLGSDPFNDFQQDFATAWHEADRARASEKRLAEALASLKVEMSGFAAYQLGGRRDGWVALIEAALSEMEGA